MNHPEFPTTSPVDTPEGIDAIWGVARAPAGCPACKQAFLVVPGEIQVLCPLCSQAELIPQPALVRCEKPELLVEPRFGQADLSRLFSSFVKDVWLHSPDFTADSLARRAVPVFWPMWLIDSQISGVWQAETGFDYQVKSSQEAYRSGNWQTTEQVETRIRWEPRCGQINRKIENVPVPAYSDHAALQKKIGPYQLGEAVPFSAAQLATAPVHLPDTHPENAWPVARGLLEKSAAAACAEAAGAQHIRSYTIQAAYTGLHWTQLLLPLYATYYTDDSGKLRGVLVNGQTGQVGGERWASQRQGWLWAGITGAAALGVMILALVCFAFSLIFPPAAVVGTLLVVVAVVTGLAALVPAVWPWQWNRRQAEQVG